MNKTFLCFCLVSLLLKRSLETLQTNQTIQLPTKNDGRVLSRKKRYLLFPEGSSMQLAQCLTVPTLGAGEVFSIGITAAVAWELPSHSDLPNKIPLAVMLARNDDWRTGDNELEEEYVSSKHVPKTYHKIYRRSRRKLYAKIESFFAALNKDGKACLHKAICEVSQVTETKGSFMVEIIKVVFRVKPHNEYPDEDAYDEAFNRSHKCDELYPNCGYSVWNNIF